MTDKELLELAAKAAHLTIEPDQDERVHHENQVVYEFKVKTPFGLRPWNPLLDDGDAFRLAVKLQLQVTPGTYNSDEFTAFHAGKGESSEFRSYLQDDFASTRRAIVRAAAKIGEPSA